MNENCTICGTCSSDHARVPRWARPEIAAEDAQRSRERVASAVAYAAERERERAGRRAA